MAPTTYYLFPAFFGHTCNSVTRWVNYFKYMAIYTNENLPNSITFCQSKIDISQNTK